MGIDAHDDVMAPKVRGGEASKHVKQWLLLPHSINREVWTRDKIWAAASAAEKRQDAREARYLDISWPRDLPVIEMTGFVESIFRRFSERGLPVQVDHEAVIAADGGANDHLHGMIGTRALSNTGFARIKNRKIDEWLRKDVRRFVADHLNRIAERNGIDVRFDPRTNIEQGTALPPEDHLPRALVRNPKTPAAKAAIVRRDEQRHLRKEHDRVSGEIEALDQEISGCMADITTQIENMAELRPLRDRAHQAPLNIEIALNAFMAAGIEMDHHITVDDVGTLYVVGLTNILDIGDRVLVDDPVSSLSEFALFVIADRKGWRDVSLTNSVGMPLPAPAIHPTSLVMALVDKASAIPHGAEGKGSVTSAAREIIREIRGSSPDARAAILNRASEHGSPDLAGLVTRLTDLADTSGKPEASMIWRVIDSTLAGDAGLWRRYVLETDLEDMCLPGSKLGRPFKPHPRYYECEYGQHKIKAGLDVESAYADTGAI